MQRNEFASNSLNEADVTIAQKFMEKKKLAVDVGIASMATLQILKVCSNGLFEEKEKNRDISSMPLPFEASVCQ